MTSFDVKDELRNIGGDIARSGINRLIDTVINSLTNYFRKRSIPKKGTATTSQNASVPPQPPIPNNTNEQSENLWYSQFFDWECITIRQGFLLLLLYEGALLFGFYVRSLFRLKARASTTSTEGTTTSAERTPSAIRVTAAAITTTATSSSTTTGQAW